jgi:hypothetical protein
MARNQFVKKFENVKTEMADKLHAAGMPRAVAESDAFGIWRAMQISDGYAKVAIARVTEYEHDGKHFEIILDASASMYSFHADLHGTGLTLKNCFATAGPFYEPCLHVEAKSRKTGYTYSIAFKLLKEVKA